MRNFFSGTYRVAWKFLGAACPRLSRAHHFYTVHADWDFARSLTTVATVVCVTVPYSTRYLSTLLIKFKLRPLSHATLMWCSCPQGPTLSTVPRAPGGMGSGSVPIPIHSTRCPGLGSCCAVFIYILYAIPYPMSIVVTFVTR